MRRDRLQMCQGIVGGMLALSLGLTMMPVDAANKKPVDHFSHQDLVLGPQEAGMVSVGRDVSLQGTTVQGNVLAGRGVNGTNCVIRGKLAAGKDANLNQCASVFAVAAGRHVMLMNTAVKRDILAGRDLLLINAIVERDATSGGQATLENAQVKGTLSAAAPRVTLKRSQVNQIRLAQPKPVQTGDVIINGRSRGSSISGNSVVVSGDAPGAMVSIGPGSTSQINGYTVKATSTETTLIAPDGTIYVNGKKVFGQGPDDYARYQMQNPKAPQVQGPGWREMLSGDSAVRADKSFAAPEQVIELIQNSVVSGDIVFEGGHGKVIVHPGSQVWGRITGGILETDPTP